MSYDRNVIIQFLNGSGDTVINDGTNDLAYKTAADTVLTVRMRPSALQRVCDNAFRTAIGALTNYSRLYLRGHGAWEATKKGTCRKDIGGDKRRLGGWDAGSVAALLHMAGLAASPLISVTGCSAARSIAFSGAERANIFQERKAALDLQLLRSTHSFSGLLHYLLGTKYRIRGDVYGRVYSLNVLGSTNKSKSLQRLYEEHGRGAKVTADGAGYEVNKRYKSKVCFYWDNGRQGVRWCDYS